MLNKTIKAKFKSMLQFFTNICKIDACCWKGRKPNKKEETSKPYKEKNIKLANSQSITLAGTSTLPSGRNPQKTRRKYCEQQLGYPTLGTPAMSVNVVDTTFNNNNSGRGQNRPPKNVSQMTCWNYNQKGHYFNKCL